MYTFFNSLSKKTAAGLFAVLLMTPTFFVLAPQKAEAQFAGFDIGSLLGGTGLGGIIDTIFGFICGGKAGMKLGSVSPDSVPISVRTDHLRDIKDFDCLKSQDTIAWLVAKYFISNLVDNVLDWVNTELDGGPIYLDNRLSFFENAFDEVNQALFTDLDTALVFGQLRDYTKEKLIADWYLPFSERLKSDFPGAEAGYEAFQENFLACSSSSPWDCWFALHNPVNNPSGVSMLAGSELDKRLLATAQHTFSDLQEGQGFMTLGECVETDAGGNCRRYERETPGQAAAKQATDSLRSSLDTLHQSDELIEALVNFLFSWIEGTITDGLRNI